MFSNLLFGPPEQEFCAFLELTIFFGDKTRRKHARPCFHLLVTARLIKKVDKGVKLFDSGEFENAFYAFTRSSSSVARPPTSGFSDSVAEQMPGGYPLDHKILMRLFSAFPDASLFATRCGVSNKVWRLLTNFR